MAEKRLIPSGADHVGEIKRLQASQKARKAAYEAGIAEDQREIGRNLDYLRDNIKAGSTTGDRIRDLLIRVHGVSDELETIYRQLDAELIGRRGEFVLLSYIVKERAYGIRDDMRSVDYYRLGVLEGEELIYREGIGTTLPISRYLMGPKVVVFESTQLKTREDLEKVHWVEKKGNIFENQLLFGPPSLDRHLISQLPEAPAALRPSNLLITVGDEAVETFLKNIAMQGFLPLAKNLLSHRLELEAS
ncbi:MAG TPA: hypothetical protein VG753_02990 [Candidatus Paceibacterota bacterium]|nr:hypothetical protein [Candidatus Paceibacterota bacterium]